MFESVVYFFNYHADKNGEQSSNKICNVGGTNVFKRFNESLKNKSYNMYTWNMWKHTNTHKAAQADGVLEEVKCCLLLCSSLEEFEDDFVWWTIKLLHN